MFDQDLCLVLFVVCYVISLISLKLFVAWDVQSKA